MRPLLIALAAALSLSVAVPVPATAQGTSGTETTPAKPTKRTRAATKPRREPTAGQMAARERQRKCSAEWKEAKTAGTTGGVKWPKFYSRCNARLKGSQV